MSGDHPKQMPADPHIDTVRQHYAAIGMVAAEWAAFELMIDYHALVLARIPSNVGGCFTAQISGSARKLDAYIAVAELLGASKTIGDLHVFAKDTAALAERRNRIVHDPWVFNDATAPQRFEVTARRKLRSMFVSVPTDSVWDCAEQIRDHCARFEALNMAVKQEIGSGA